jgi:hypothetical protein
MSCCTSPAKHPLHHFHGFSVGHAHALHKLALLAQSVQRGFNLRAAAVHHHRVHAHQLEQHHVFGKVGLQGRVGHGVAAVLDDDGLAVEFADVRQRLGEDLGLVARGYVGQVCGHGAGVKYGMRKLCRIQDPQPILFSGAARAAP